MVEVISVMDKIFFDRRRSKRDFLYRMGLNCCFFKGVQKISKGVKEFLEGWRFFSSCFEAFSHDG